LFNPVTMNYWTIITGKNKGQLVIIFI